MAKDEKRGEGDTRKMLGVNKMSDYIILFQTSQLRSLSLSDHDSGNAVHVDI